MIGPAPVPAGCSQGPPDAPPESPQLPSHQLAVPVVPSVCEQYRRLGS
jgi:hypothetical protein